MGDKKLRVQTPKVETNKYGVNKAITYNILPENEMRKIGFTDHNSASWYFCKSIKFPKNKKYRGSDITFNVVIPKKIGELDISVLDEWFGQPYDYQRMLVDNPDFDICLIVKEQVEGWMEYLQYEGVLEGHIYGEYI